MAEQAVIGIGNPLRGDDAVGWLLASEVGGRCVPQLTPELAADVSLLRRVLFVDAWRMPGDEAADRTPVILERLGTDTGREAGGSHGLLPCQLMAISSVLYDRCPQASILLVPAVHFELGEPLSAPLRRRLAEARGLIATWLHIDGPHARHA